MKIETVIALCNRQTDTQNDSLSSLYGAKNLKFSFQPLQENGTAYSQSYSGQYGLPGDGTDLGQLDMFLNVSMDGVSWEQAGSSNITYHGGLTEVGFSFDLQVWPSYFKEFSS